MFTWDAGDPADQDDGAWTYSLQDRGRIILRFNRVSSRNQKTEIYEENDATGMTAEKSAEGEEIQTYRFVSGPLDGA